MTNDFTAFATISAVPGPPFPGAAPPVPGAAPPKSAAEQLDDVMARVGVDGLVAAMADPGLLAEVDQHAAAVRDALAGAGREVDAESLASYARSIEAAARRMSRPVPVAGKAYVSGAAWRTAEWHLIRLLAVCAIAESAGLL